MKLNKEGKINKEEFNNLFLIEEKIREL